MAQMTLDQLRIFLTVAEYLHFTRAADALYIPQPAVSAAIQNLETEYGLKLFHRLGRRIELTEAGKLLSLEAQKILDQVALTERALKELSNLQRGELKLGSSLTIGNYWLPEKISQFQCHYPNININCTLANSEEICLATEAGKFDLGLIEGDIKADLKEVFYQEKIGGDRLLIVVGKQHPWFNLESVKISDLYHTEWIMRESGSGTQQRLEEALIKWGIVPEKLKTTLIFNTGEMIKAVLENSQAAAGISDLMVKKEIKLGTLKAIKIYLDRGKKTQELEMNRPFLKIKHKDRFQTKVAQVFEKLITML